MPKYTSVRCQTWPRLTCRMSSPEKGLHLSVRTFALVHGDTVVLRRSHRQLERPRASPSSRSRRKTASTPPDHRTRWHRRQSDGLGGAFGDEHRARPGPRRISTPRRRDSPARAPESRDGARPTASRASGRAHTALSVCAFLLWRCPMKCHRKALRRRRASPRGPGPCFTDDRHSGVGERGHGLDAHVLRRRHDGHAGPDLCDDPLVALPDCVSRWWQSPPAFPSALHRGGGRNTARDGRPCTRRAGPRARRPRSECSLHSARRVEPAGRTTCADAVRIGSATSSSTS